ncbi:hypothetical protein EMIHUDRAFT_100487 [Emiliania huxleyi CCMP1516]|uniref:alpha-L-rhamnosidase n=2 Tax=Emiliania huxleyi TaxID=2903 RepID=A0A0D3JSD9_EMIH1|nr:hypothetical protein EMIHUDRAFT_100487 [Emiliania huxleyi CCMP1516]EOD26424.1 hypothetical protein EMIHUDRAFT_100487 [Emiliania huxleyi CCMP1516]|eukprot:XP_005778853.1 hypothetical protein EMIHUDRAFT_100487 [Emiliania huxleyi CCMP1516]
MTPLNSLLPLFPPIRLRASSSDWFASPKFALPHGSTPVFSWAPQHTDRGSVQASFNLTIWSAVGRVVWSGDAASSQPRMRYPPDAPRLEPGTYVWQVATREADGRISPPSAPSALHVALGHGEWDGVPWLGSASKNVYSTTFDCPAGAVTSVLYICGLGYSRVELNGHVLNTLTTAPWTQYAYVNGFSTLDVKDLLLVGEPNRLVVSLGRGWRDRTAFRILKGDDVASDGKVERVVRAKLVATLSTGDSVALSHTGDGKWHAAAGPTTADSVYNGEEYDARVAERLGDGPHNAISPELWSKAAPLDEGDAPAGVMTAWAAPAVTVTDSIAPVALTNPRKGLYVADFGRRLTGVVRLNRMICKEGTRVILRHAEIMQHAGLPDVKTADPAMIYVGELRGARATDVYTCSGRAGGETWQPSLTYHGFRFVEINVTNSGVRPAAAMLTALHFHSGVALRTHAHFNSTTLNRMQHLAVSAQQSNLQTIPTDCDQRDERLGWMGDASLSSESMALNFEMAPFFSWWVRHVVLPEQRAGALPDVVPFVRYGGRPADVSWSAALPSVAHAVCDVYGDTETYREAASAIAALVDEVGVEARAGLGKMRTPYGDWCPPPARMGKGQGRKPSPPLTSAFSYALMVQQAAELARAAGNASEGARYASLGREIVSNFHTAFYVGNGTFDTSGTQTANVLGLALGGAPDVGLARRRLLSLLRARRTHYDTGIVGFKFLFDVLDQAQAHDAALAVLSQTDYPSIGYYFANSLEPATANLWELPDAPAEGTGMNSRNHHMWSSYSAYLVKSVAGLHQQAGTHGFQRLELRPSGAYALSGASVTVDLPHGTARLSWVRSGGRQHDKVSEGETARLSCGPSGGRISAVSFASFGTPSIGSPSDLPSDGRRSDGFETDPACHALRSSQAVAEACVGRNSCEVPATRVFFGERGSLFCTTRRDPLASPLRLWLTVACEVAADSLRVEAGVPVGSTARLLLPLRGMATPHLRESGRSVYLATDPSASSAARKANRLGSVQLTEDERTGRILAVELPSGLFDFDLSDAATPRAASSATEAAISV